MMPKRIHLTMIVITQKGKKVNHAGFHDAKKNSLDNDCPHKKRGECECMNIGF